MNTQNTWVAEDDHLCIRFNDVLKHLRDTYLDVSAAHGQYGLLKRISAWTYTVEDVGYYEMHQVLSPDPYSTTWPKGLWEIERIPTYDEERSALLFSLDSRNEWVLVGLRGEQRTSLSYAAFILMDFGATLGLTPRPVEPAKPVGVCVDQTLASWLI